MRTALIATMVVFLLAGCTSDPGLGRYMVRLSDLPADCDFLPDDHPEAEFLRDELNWTGNPGSVDNEVFDEGAGPPVANLVVWYRCDDAEVISVAVQYATPEAARAFIIDETDCARDDDDDGFLAKGNIVAFIDGDADSNADVYEEALNQAVERLKRSTGLMSACDYLASS